MAITTIVRWWIVDGGNRQWVHLKEYIMDKNIFYREIGQSLFNGRLSPGQRDGIEVKIDVFDRHGIADERWRAYMLATSYHETACTM